MCLRRAAEPLYLAVRVTLRRHFGYAIYNNGDNCDERQIAEKTITLLNGDIAAAVEIHTVRDLGGRENERT